MAGCSDTGGFRTMSTLHESKRHGRKRLRAEGRTPPCSSHPTPSSAKSRRNTARCAPRRSARSARSRDPCLEMAIRIREQHGIWGGLNELERKARRRHLANAGRGPACGRRSAMLTRRCVEFLGSSRSRPRGVHACLSRSLGTVRGVADLPAAAGQPAARARRRAEPDQPRLRRRRQRDRGVPRVRPEHPGQDRRTSRSS